MSDIEKLAELRKKFIQKDNASASISEKLLSPDLNNCEKTFKSESKPEKVEQLGEVDPHDQ